MDPRHFCERLDALYALQPGGVTARIAYESGRQWRRYRTIFDSPNAANAVAFSRWASDAAKNRPIGEWLDFLAPSRRWQTYTWQWLADRYGADAGPLLARVFERTPQIVHGRFVVTSARISLGNWRYAWKLGDVGPRRSYPGGTPKDEKSYPPRGGSSTEDPVCPVHPC